MTGVTNDSPAGAIKNALSGFSNSLIWLIGIAIVISRGLAKTGLGNRIGYYFISLFGRKTIGIGYALAALLPGLVCIALVPLVVYVVYPPEIKSTPDARTYAQSKLAEMGPMSYGEKVMVAVFALLLTLWAGVPAMILGADYAVNTTAVAFLGLSVLLISGVLTWEDVLKEKSAWDTVVWFSALVMMATFLNQLGLVAWFSNVVEGNIEQLGYGWIASTVILVAVY